MRSLGISALACALSLAGPAAMASAQDLSIGRNVALASSGTTLIPLGSVGYATATIEKAKRKHVIVIDGTVSFAGSDTIQRLELGTRIFRPPSVGDVPGEGAVVATDCTGAPNGYCTLTGHWYVDIDALEAAEPGTWVNRPVTVDLQGGTLPPGSTGLGSYSLRVQMLKK